MTPHIDPGHDHLVAALPPPGGGHPTTVVAAAGMAAHVDTELADLVHALWRAGCLTRYSCQDQDPAVPGRDGVHLMPRLRPWGFIAFADLTAFERFFRLTAPTVPYFRRWRSQVVPSTLAGQLNVMGHLFFPMRDVPDMHAAVTSGRPGG